MTLLEELKSDWKICLFIGAAAATYAASVIYLDDVLKYINEQSNNFGQSKIELTLENLAHNNHSEKQSNY